MSFMIRPMLPEEYPLLEEFLYQAIFVPEGFPAPDRKIIRLPELQLYIKDFGKAPHDQAMVAEAEGQVVGAAWVRIMADYGHIDDETPSLSVSLLPAYRGKGIGKVLLETFLASLKKGGCCKVSLSVQKANPAVHLYRQLGFHVFKQNQEDFVMVCRL
ncbi:GNAT family N-acetyltransferase [Streptococcus chenjunshii]|uniref:GNAT family N-acetyltransferase n=1 Tax=Streptococcus chenjunshii TaxID=2173853 RepID=A0A372KME8_9STRE|nr:GNAT family N-acetyltransferase [Streptococcus chenjunshii]AXQ78171.1 GNAT family N-acetyltransferase [Streptococcus chenjunshii]RFU50684.1 GNAT family N-acetyltransferase [Streptococcus chenjunshii]RFU53455.1 GNAT family N-acetyltransferase [Streptococcus chenjunshii]